MNYIKQLSGFLQQAHKDERINPYHISLYLALFHRWNMNYFNNPVSILRDEIMHLSKIGSVNTYTKCLKQLSAWKYIKYHPSQNRYKGSTVHMYTFDNTSEIDVIPLINNNTNNTNFGEQAQKTELNFLTMKNEKIDNSEILTQIQNSPLACLPSGRGENPKGKGAEKEKSFAKKVEGFTRNPANSGERKEPAPEKQDSVRFQPPILEHVQIYFCEKGIDTIEAEKFFNYFESNGWLVGGRSKMRDWKAAARNWILNIPKFNHRPKPLDRPIHLNPSKNYNEPL